MHAKLLSFTPAHYDLNDKKKKTRVLILCEDYSTACRARVFVESMTENKSVEFDLSDAVWHIKMINVPVVSSKLAVDVSLCDYLFVSLRGDVSLSAEIKRWFAQLNATATKLIVMVDPKHCKMKAMLSTLRYLKKATGMIVSNHFPDAHPKEMDFENFMPELPQYEMPACFA